MRIDRFRKALKAPDSGPYKMLQRMDRCFKIDLRDGRTIVVSIGRIKPAVVKTPIHLPFNAPDISDVFDDIDVPDVSDVTDAPDVSLLPL